jgi:putative ABC transport system permease protein
MRLVDQISASLRNIRRQKLRSSLTILAVVIGATSVTIMLSLVTSAKSFFVNQYKSTGQLEQVLVTRETGLDFQQASSSGGGNSDTGVKLTDAVAQKIRSLPHVSGVAVTAQPYIFEHMVLGTMTVPVKGVRADESNGVIVHSMLAGADLTGQDGAGVVLLSKSYADKLGYSQRYPQLVGQQLTLVTQPSFTGQGAVLSPPPTGGPGRGPSSTATGPGPPGDQRPTEIPATVKGIVEDDNQAVYFPLSWARDLMTSRHYEPRGGGFGTQPQMVLVTQRDLEQQGYSTIVVRADDTARVDSVAKDIRSLGLGAATARSFIAKQLQMFDILSLLLAGIGAIALAVAALGVINTMVMAILERTRQIGIMRACGATRATVRHLFVLEAACLGCLGGVFGVATGFGLTRVANVIINKQLTHASLRVHDIIGLPGWLVLVVVAATTTIGLLSGLYPAHRAARLDPVQALHYE